MFFAAAASCVFLCKVNNCNVTRAMCVQMLKLCHLKSFESLLNFASCSVPLKYCFTATAELQLVNLAPRWFIATVAELGQNFYTSLSLSLCFSLVSVSLANLISVPFRCFDAEKIWKKKKKICQTCQTFMCNSWALEKKWICVFIVGNMSVCFSAYLRFYLKSI